MNESVLCHHIDDAVLFRNLHCDGEIVDSFGREEDVGCFFLERWIGRLVINFNNMKLKDRHRQ